MAKKPIDVYRDWLGIKDAARPLNHYQLLRLKAFEDDAATVRSHYRKLNAHVRKFATGEYAEESQDLLNELAKAMLCLTDVQRKREYDASLGRRDGSEGRRRTLEEILLSNKIVDQDKLARARTFAGAVGLDLHQAILQQKLAAPDVVMLAYAESQGLPYVELDDVGVDEQLAPQVPPPMARQHSCVPVMVDGGMLLMASPQPLVPDVEEELRLRFNMPVRTVLCTTAAVNAAIGKYYGRDATLVAAPAAQTTKSAGGAAAAPARPAAPPKTQAEQAKQRYMAAIVAFNLGVMGLVFYRMLLSSTPYMGFISVILPALGVGLLAGGLTFVVMMLKK